MHYDSSCPACTAESQFLIKSCHKIQAKAVNDNLDELNQAGISQLDATTLSAFLPYFCSSSL